MGDGIEVGDRTETLRRVQERVLRLPKGLRAFLVLCALAAWVLVQTDGPEGRVSLVLANIGVSVLGAALFELCFPELRAHLRSRTAEDRHVYRVAGAGLLVLLIANLIGYAAGAYG